MEKSDLTSVYYAVITDLRDQAAASLRLADDLEKRMPLAFAPRCINVSEDYIVPLSKTSEVEEPIEVETEVLNEPSKDTSIKVSDECKKSDKVKKAPKVSEKKPPTSSKVEPSKLKLPMKPKEVEVSEIEVDPTSLDASIQRYAREGNCTFTGLIDEVLAEFPDLPRIKISQAIMSQQKNDKLRKHGNCPRSGDPYVRAVVGGMIYLPDEKLSQTA